MPACEHFYGRATKGVAEGLYKIYVLEASLCGAKIAGIIYDEPSARFITFQFGLLGFLLGKWLGQRAMKKREATEQTYVTLEPGSAVFLGRHKANFCIAAAQIKSARLYSPSALLVKASEKNIMLELILVDSSKRLFSIIGETNRDRVNSLLAGLLPSLEISQS